MQKLITPLVLLGLAVAVFFVGGTPFYQDVQKLKAEGLLFDEASASAQQLIARRNSLLDVEKGFSEEDRVRLEKMLPFHPDNIKLTRDLDVLAARYGMSISRVQVVLPADTTSGTLGDTKPYGFADISFSTSGSYRSFSSLIQDIERNLRLLDVRSVAFNAGEFDIYEYTVTIRAYWIKQ